MQKSHLIAVSVQLWPGLDCRTNDLMSVSSYWYWSIVDMCTITKNVFVWYPAHLYYTWFQSSHACTIGCAMRKLQSAQCCLTTLECTITEKVQVKKEQRPQWELWTTLIAYERILQYCDDSGEVAVPESYRTCCQAFVSTAQQESWEEWMTRV